MHNSVANASIAAADTRESVVTARSPIARAAIRRAPCRRGADSIGAAGNGAGRRRRSAQRLLSVLRHEVQKSFGRRQAERLQPTRPRLTGEAARRQAAWRDDPDDFARLATR